MRPGDTTLPRHCWWPLVFGDTGPLLLLLWSWSLLDKAGLCYTLQNAQPAGPSWTLHPGSLLGCLASCWMLGWCVPTFYLVADIFMVVMRGPFAVAVVAMVAVVRARRGGRKWARAAQTADYSSVLGWLGWAGWVGLGWAGWAGEDVGSPSELLTPYNPLVHHPTL